MPERLSISRRCKASPDARGIGVNQLTSALDAPRREIDNRAGPLSFYVAGHGAPMLLVHSINAAASAYEVKPIFDAMVESRHVYAVDFPGFGFSDRSDRAYTPRLYTDAILDMLDVIAEDHAETPVDALAVSLGCEFLGRAAVEQPQRFCTLALVTPTGFGKGSSQMRAPAGGTREIPGIYRVFTFPLWSQCIYSLLVSKPSMRYFLRKTFGSFRSGPRHLRLSDGASAGREERAFRVRLGAAVQQRHSSDLGTAHAAGVDAARNQRRFPGFQRG